MNGPIILMNTNGDKLLTCSKKCFNVITVVVINLYDFSVRIVRLFTYIKFVMSSPNNQVFNRIQVRYATFYVT